MAPSSATAGRPEASPVEARAAPPPVAAVCRTAALVLAAALAACGPQASERETARRCPSPPSGEVALPGGEFVMGADPLLPEEGPPRRVLVGPFAIDRTEVTNRDFAAFVSATGYVTLAERPPDPRLYPGVDPARLKPSSIVFVGAEADPRRADPSRWWRVVDGANWRRPEGPGSSIGGREDEPVVHVAYDDALAYARWRGRDLPTEAEWEYAARGGLDGARYAWGDDPDAAARANHWQGPFPALDTGSDGHAMTRARVGCYPSNGFGLHDMAGNVWEWTHDAAPGPDASDPPRRIIKGGSYLCAKDFCFRYRPAARQPGPPDTGASHIGFRTVGRHVADDPTGPPRDGRR